MTHNKSSGLSAGSHLHLEMPDSTVDYNSSHPPIAKIRRITGNPTKTVSKMSKTKEWGTFQLKK